MSRSSLPTLNKIQLQWNKTPPTWFSQTASVSSITQSGLILCNTVNCSMPGLPVHHQLPEFTQTHWVGDAIQPSHPLSSPSPPAPNPSLHQGLFLISQLFAWGGQSIGVSASTSVLPMNTQDWSPPRMDWLDLLAVQGTLKSFLQHHSKASIFRHSAFFTVQHSHPYMTTRKTIALTRQTFVGKVMSLLFNMLSRLVITFLPRSISWLQSPSAGILEPTKIKPDTVSTVSPSIFHEVMGTRCHDLCFLNVELWVNFFTLLFHFHQEGF